MADIAHFLAMGGYAVFVWPAFGVAVAIMLAMLVHSVTRYRRAQRDLARLEREDAS